MKRPEDSTCAMPIMSTAVCGSGSIPASKIVACRTTAASEAINLVTSLAINPCCHTVAREVLDKEPLKDFHVRSRLFLQPGKTHEDR